MAESNINNGAFEGDQTASSTWEAFNEAKQDFNYLESTKATVEQATAAANGVIWKATLAEVNAIDPLVVDRAYGVYDDGANNGYYYWDGSSATVTFNRDLGAEKTNDINDTSGKVITAESVKNYALSKDDTIDLNVGKNQWDGTLQQDIFLNSSTGNIQPAGGNNDWQISTPLPCSEGVRQILSGTRGRQGISFLANENDTEAISYLSSSVMPIAIIPPAGANFFVFAVTSPTNTNYSNLMVEFGNVATSYEPYTLTESIKPSLLPSNIPFEVSLDENQITNTYISNVIGGSVLKQQLRIFDNDFVFNPSETTYGGVSFATFVDEAAPYRIDGGTIGANHDNTSSNSDYRKRLFVDGIEIFDFNKKYYPSKSFAIQESYDIIGLNTSGIVATVSILNEYDNKGTLTIKTDFYALQTVDLLDIMFIMSTSIGGAYDLYIPKSLPFTVGSDNYDFASVQDMTPALNTTLRFNPNTVCETSGILCDRAIQIKNGLGMATGYLPIQDADIARRRELATEKALELRAGSKKIYMSAVDPSGTGTLTAGDYYSVIAYKSFFESTADETCNYSIDNNGDVYVYLDWHTAGLKRFDLPTNTAGKSYEVIEKSVGVDIKSQAATGSMLADVALTSGYAYLTLKFSI